MSLEKEYRYGKVYINKHNGLIAEVLDSWLGKVFFLSETIGSKETLNDLCKDGLLYFSDMPEGDITKWELVGEI